MEPSGAQPPSHFIQAVCSGRSLHTKGMLMTELDGRWAVEKLTNEAQEENYSMCGYLSPWRFTISPKKTCCCVTRIYLQFKPDLFPC